MEQLMDILRGNVSGPIPDEGETRKADYSRELIRLMDEAGVKASNDAAMEVLRRFDWTGPDSSNRDDVLEAASDEALAGLSSVGGDPRQLFIGGIAVGIYLARNRALTAELIFGQMEGHNAELTRMIGQRISLGKKGSQAAFDRQQRDGGS